MWPLTLFALQLPYNSGWRLSSLENEELVRSCVANLVELSKHQLAGVVKELLGVLENLNKVSEARTARRLSAVC